jgi:integrase
MLVLTAVLKSARLWAPLQESYGRLAVCKRGPGKSLTPEQTAKLIETAKTNDRWFVALCATVLAYATGCRAGEIKTLRLGDLELDSEQPCIRLAAENTKGRRDRKPALNDLGLWAVRELLKRATLLGAVAPAHHLLPADLSKTHQANRSPSREVWV